LKTTLKDLQSSYQQYMSGEFGEPESGMLTFMKAEIKDTTEEMFREAKRQR